MDKAQLEKFYEHHYKKLLLIPLILFALSIGVLFFNYSQTGEFINKEVSLKGGITATVNLDSAVSIEELESFLRQKFDADITIRSLADFSTRQHAGIIVELGRIEALSLEEQDRQLQKALESFFGSELTQESYSSEEIGSSLGQAFFRQLLISLGVAFIFMGIIVFFIYRTLIPSVAVMLAALIDIVVTLAIVSSFGMRLSSAGIAAFLLVIGYSIDTDILLTTRVLKRRGEGSLFERMFNATKTGLTMTVTTVVALLTAFFVTNSIVLKQMFLIILIALFVDVLATYFTNAGILKYYCHKKGIV